MIRGYEPSDYPSVFQVYRQSFGQEFTERLLKDHLFTSDQVWVKTHGAAGVVGYLLAEFTDGVPYLSQVAVHGDLRSYGFATDLIKKFEKHYSKQGAEKSWLQVKVENPSQTLYFKLGYRVTKFEPNLYGPGKHGLRMEKSLASEVVSFSPAGNGQSDLPQGTVKIYA